MTTCPIPHCDFVIEEDVEAVLAAAQLNLHALVHQQRIGHTTGSSKQKPPKIVRPSISRGSTDEEWQTFLKRWDLFKRGTEIPNGQLTTQLWQCCDDDLEVDLFRSIDNVMTVNEATLLNAIKRLAVISTAESVRKTELLSMRQDHGQPVRSFVAKVKGKAQVCSFTKTCTASLCSQQIDFSDEIVKYVVISGIADEEIKKDVLGHADLDTRSLNDTITLIENKEMAVRAMSSGASSGDSNMAIHQQGADLKHPTGHYTCKDGDQTLQMKTNCRMCNKVMMKFKLRRGQPKEFTHCINCWKKIHTTPSGNSNSKNTSNNGAIFDVLGAISDPLPALKLIPKKKLRHPVTLQHHIFDGTYGWMVKESRKQPSITLKISTNKLDYDHLNLPCPKIKPSKVSVITDTGAQSSLMGLKVFRSCGFKNSDLLPVKKKMFAANNEGISILGAVFTRLSGVDLDGNRIETADMIYVSDTTDLFYLSRHTMEQLKIISSDFPTIGAAASLSDSPIPVPLTGDPSQSNVQSAEATCKCLKRKAPPPRPEKLPFVASEENNEKMKQWLLERYSKSTFNQCPHQPLPMMTGPPINITIDPEATPTTIHTPASIPIHWREEVKKQLDADVALGVIEKVEPNTPTTWCHRAIWVRKSDGSPRRVVDFQSLNRHCLRDTHHTVPPFNQARAIPHGTYRSVTDAWNGYHSVPVRKEDRHLLTFITEFGRYRYCVAPQGYMASGDGYTHRYDRIITDIPRKTKCVDDTALWDNDLEQHWWRMIDYLELTGREGIVLNPRKFQFAREEIDFAGFRITKDNVKPLPKYLESIASFPRPKSIADIRAWFGLVNQVSHYNKLVNIMAPFKPLLSPKTRFEWTDELDVAFNRSKAELVEAIKHGVRIFDPLRRTCLSSDWSKTGVGYWLRQKYCECESTIPDCCDQGWRITLAGSRFLRSSEQRYAPIEGEALAIAWALEDTKFFTLGCDELVITTDHKPLVKIFGDRSLDEISNTRIFRLKQRTLAWRFDIVHVPGKSIPASDATSRNPAMSTSKIDGGEWLLESHQERLSVIHSNVEEHMEEEIIAAISSSLNKIKAVTWHRVKEASNTDQHIRILKDFIQNGFPESYDHLPMQLRPYWQHRGSMSIVDDVILVGDRILVPPSLRDVICKILHSAHQGTNAMRERAKVTVFWPGITDAINVTREKCTSCWQMTPSQPHLPPANPFIPSYPFEAIAADFCKQGGHHYLITVDRFSNWPEVLKVNPGGKNAGSSGLVNALKSYFSTFGVPEELSSDGGPEFKSMETSSFLVRWGVKHRMSSAYNPRSNGRAEVAVKSMKRLLSNNVSLNGEVNTDAFTQAILQFRNTPDPENHISPAEIVFGRPLRDCLPVKPDSQIFTNDNVRPIWIELWKKREDTLRTRFARQTEALATKTRKLPPLQIGDNCRIQNQHGQSPKKWDRTGKVVEVKDNDQYTIKVDGSGRLTLRNRRYLRKINLLVEQQRPRLSAEPVIAQDLTEDSLQQQTLTPQTPTPPPNVPSTSIDLQQDVPVTTGDNDQPTIEPHQQPNRQVDHIITSGGLDCTPVERDAVGDTRPARVRKPPRWHTDYIMK